MTRKEQIEALAKAWEALGDGRWCERSKNPAAEGAGLALDEVLALLNDRNTCDTCRFWEPPHDAGTDRGDCGNPKLISLHDCPGEPSPDSLVYWDAEFYAAFLTTGPKFGCVHWASKGPTETQGEQE